MDGLPARRDDALTNSPSESAVPRLVDAAVHARSLLLAMCVLSLLSACGASPPQPTIIAAAVDATGDLNPDSRGRASPVVLRLFELKTVAAFNSADFFSLWDRESETLGAELVAREEFQLRPGERTSFERTLQADTAHVAVIAAFRDLERAQWRAAVTVVPHRKQALAIRLDARSVTLSAR
jgi:type VI secretion system protein VasD